MRVKAGLIAGLMACVANAAQAQSCLGLPGLAQTSKLLSLSATGRGSDRIVLSRFAWSGQRAFLGLQAGYAANEFKSPQAPVVGADFGYAFKLGKSRALELCPVAQITYQNGRNTGVSHQTYLTTTLGASLGRHFRLSNSFAVNPFVYGGVQQIRSSYGYTYLLDANGTSVWGTRNQAVAKIRIGTGIRLGSVLTLTPSLAMPLGAGYLQDYGMGYSNAGREFDANIIFSFRIPR